MSSTALKLFALLLMFIDHIGEFIPGIPVWFRWLGRISAPIFFFCMAWGFTHTHNRKKYVMRMYFFSVGMSILTFILNNIYRDRAYYYITNNIFSTLLLVAIVIWIIETMHTDKKKGNWLIFGFIAWQFAAFFIFTFGNSFLKALMPSFDGYMPLLGSITASIVTAEGGFIFIGLGVLIYFYKDTNARLITAYGIFCAVFFALSTVGSYTYESLFNFNYQWMMFFSLPFMLLYNGKKGKGLKYFFYIFYPAHIVILFLVGTTFVK